MNEMDFNLDAPLHIRSVSHLTIPVKDRYKAARFYVVVLGAEVHHESAPDNVKMGRSRSLQVGVRVCPGLEVDLFEQDYGQPTWDQSHPHLALDVPTEDLDRWAAHLKKWRVPFFGPMTRGQSGSGEIYFNDPDSNNLELNCPKYPGAEKLHSGPYDKQVLIYNEAWPPPELKPEVERLFQASLERMRARRQRA
jgi:catechol-2,3-dioxygenase